MAVASRASPVLLQPGLLTSPYEPAQRPLPDNHDQVSGSWRDEDNELPVYDLEPFLNGQYKNIQELQAFCSQVAACLRDTGCVVVRDPRVGRADSEGFLDLMEQYFSQSESAKLEDARPDVHYQVGATPGGVEIPRCLIDTSARQALEACRPGQQAVFPAGPDPKWRFMWRVGPRPVTTAFPEMNAEPVIPRAFAGEWPRVMDSWGTKMLATVGVVAEVVARGFGLQPDAFTRRMQCGPHLLAPTGANLAEYEEPGACIAGYHSDLNFLTIHGKSRFPGLHIWLRDGRRIPVRIPEGCLFLQAGMQLEWLTGGHVKAGMHEVIVSEATLAAVAAARISGRSLWRVSSTVFAHIASDETLTPLGPFSNSPPAGAYPPTLAGEQVSQELERIGLKRNK